jgi:hypothetical protein
MGARLQSSQSAPGSRGLQDEAFRATAAAEFLTQLIDAVVGEVLLDKDCVFMMERAGFATTAA